MAELGEIPKNFYKYTENNFKIVIKSWGSSPKAQQVNNVSAMQEMKDMGLVPGSGRSPRRGHGNPLQYS